MIKPEKNALIIGAGIAGSSLAYQLAKRNYQVTLLDGNNQHEIEIFQNKAAMISPHFMLNNPKYNSLMSKASKYAYDLTNEFNYPKEDALMEGVIKLYENDMADKLIEKIVSLGLEKADFKYLPKNLIKKKYGIENKAGILFKCGGWVSPNKICSSLINHKNIKFIPKTKVKEITYIKNLWVTSCDDSNKYAASNLILCNSFALNEISLFRDIDLKKNRGQINWLPSKKKYGSKEIISDGGYLIPDVSGFDVFGSTYERDNENKNLSMTDFDKNLKTYQKLSGVKIEKNDMPITGWVGWRAVTPDRTPYVGHVLDESKEVYNKPRSIQELKWHPNLFINTGYGSRGYTLAPFISKCLASLISGSQTPIEEDILNYLNPSRNSIKKMGLRKKMLTNSV
jgi:tRNA 5-methylaminomethyl-2-thiouridine biosynthesis bifunctional protein